MYLQFETQEDRPELPILVDPESVMHDSEISGVKIDGLSVELDAHIVERFKQTVAVINGETLPAKHFRDCSHFVIALCGFWMPTHRPFDRDFDMEIQCEDQNTSAKLLGPMAIGIPNDEQCLGYDSQPFVYCHSTFGTVSSAGNLCFSKLGTRNEYSLSFLEALLSEYSAEVSHPIQRLRVHQTGTTIFEWEESIDR